MTPLRSRDSLRGDRLEAGVAAAARTAVFALAGIGLRNLSTVAAAEAPAGAAPVLSWAHEVEWHVCREGAEMVLSRVV